jgi:hypothetical protein
VEVIFGDKHLSFLQFGISYQLKGFGINFFFFEIEFCFCFCQVGANFFESLQLKG